MIEPLFREVELPADVRAFVPARFTRCWRPTRKIDIRILWDSREREITVFGEDQELNLAEMSFLRQLERDVRKGRA